MAGEHYIGSDAGSVGAMSSREPLVYDLGEHVGKNRNVFRQVVPADKGDPKISGFQSIEIPCIRSFLQMQDHFFKLYSNISSSAPAEGKHDSGESPRSPSLARTYPKSVRFPHLPKKLKMGLVSGVSSAATCTIVYAPGAMILKARNEFAIPKMADMTLKGCGVGASKSFIKWSMFDFAQIGVKKTIDIMRANVMCWPESYDRVVVPVLASSLVCYGICPVERLCQIQIAYQQSLFDAVKHIRNEGWVALFNGSHISAFTNVVNYVAHALGEQMGNTPEQRAKIAQKLRNYLAPFLFLLHVLKGLQQSKGVSLIQALQLLSIAFKDKPVTLLGHMILNAFYFGTICNKVYYSIKLGLENMLKVNESELTGLNSKLD